MEEDYPRSSVYHYILGGVEPSRYPSYKIISIFCLCDLNMVGYQVSSYGIQLDNKYAGFFNLKL